jgi:putative nucleotidyltransferase with HDIG domain
MTPTHPIAPETLRQRVRELPALPEAVRRVQATLQDEDARADDCAVHIARDQALAAKTLRLANSAFYGVPGRVSSIQDAVQVLGLRTLSTLLQAAALTGGLGGSACKAFQAGEFWRNSIGTAICARTLASELWLDPNVAFTAGLLHDIGRLALATHFPEQFGAALALQQREKLPPLQAERRVMGTDHAQVGALVAAHWHYPADIAQAIAQHHEPAPRKAGGPTVIEVVHVADAIAHAVAASAGPNDKLPPLSPPSWERLGLGGEKYLGVIDQTKAGVESLCQALGV